MKSNHLKRIKMSLVIGGGDFHILQLEIIQNNFRGPHILIDADLITVEGGIDLIK